jgi:hypothetical protein
MRIRSRLHRRYMSLEDRMKALAHLSGAIVKRAQAADGLAWQLFQAFCGVCDALGLHVSIGEGGRIEMAGATANAPETLAFHMEVMRVRRERGAHQ